MRRLLADWRARALILVLVSALVCVYLMRNTDVSEALRLLGSADPLWWLLALASFLFGHICRYGRYLMVWGWRPGLPSAAITSLHGVASYFLPMRLGELVLPALSRRLGEQGFLVALAGLIWIRLFDLVMVLCLAALAMLALGPQSLLVTQLAAASGVSGAQLTGTAMDLAMMLAVLVLLGVGWWMLGRFERLDAVAARLKFCLLSVLVWAAVLAMNDAIAASLSLSLPFPVLVWLVVGMTFAYALPIQGLAGLGVHQLVWFLALTSVKVAPDPALQLTIASHVLVVACVLVLGMLGAVLGLLARQRQRA